MTAKRLESALVLFGYACSIVGVLGSYAYYAAGQRFTLLDLVSWSKVAENNTIVRAGFFFDSFSIDMDRLSPPMIAQVVIGSIFVAGFASWCMAVLIRRLRR
jgi:hypothetical protein